MLESLTIKNYALLADVEIEFSSGLNILTGETGAGKSIVVGALSTILGERVDTAVVRDDSSKAVVEGIFRINNNDLILRFLQKNDLMTDDSQLILRREILSNGRSRAFINDTPVQLSRLQELGDYLVDLHGQHDHQSLLKTKKHLDFIDAFGGFDELRKEVRSKYQQLQELLHRLKQLQEKQKEAAERRDLLQFQISEIENVHLSVDEEEALLKEEKILQNHERLYALTSSQYVDLYEGEDSVVEKLHRLQNSLMELAEIDERFSNYNSECESARLVIEEIAIHFQNYRSHLDFNPKKLEETQNRIAEIASLKKKYNRTVRDILGYRDEMKVQLTNLENLDDDIEQLKNKINIEQGVFSKRCVDLHEYREAAGRRLEKLIPEILNYLGMPESRFKVMLEYQDDPKGLVVLQGKAYRASASGMDIASFFISTNIGEEPKPLAKVASGGEISRIMLAMKSVLAKKGLIPILVFDEIDNGVSGRIARAVGRKLRNLSESHQVICITHLPQIASIGNSHLYVEKIEKNGRTETRIKRLTSEERTIAIAKLLAGDNVTESHLNSARELMMEASGE